MRDAGMNVFLFSPSSRARPGTAIGPLLLALALAAAVGSDAQAVREMESSGGTVRITIVPMDAPAASPAVESLSVADYPRAQDTRADSVHPVAAIADFTSLGEMARDAEAMLQVAYFDKASREELIFPLKYSELRRYLRTHPLDYREGSLAERNVALMGDLARALRTRMTPAAGMGKKP